MCCLQPVQSSHEVDETALQQALKAAEASAAAAPQPLDATLYTPLLPRVLTSVARVYAARLQPIQAEGVLRSAIDMSAGEGARARRLRRHAAFHLAALFGKWEGREREVLAFGALPCSLFEFQMSEYMNTEILSSSGSLAIVPIFFHFFVDMNYIGLLQTV